MPPKPVVDRWLLGMEKRALVLVEEGTKALAEQKSEDSASVIGLLGEPPPPLSAVSMRDAATADGFPLPLGVAFVAIVLIGLGLEALRFTGQRSKETTRPAAVVSTASEREATVSLLGLGIVVVRPATVLADAWSGSAQR